MGILGPSTPKGKELVHAGNIPVAAFSDVTQAILRYGSFDYLIGGPGLTADFLNINTNAKKGRLYVIFVDTFNELQQHFEDDKAFTLVPNTPLGTMYIRPEYAVALMNPSNHGMGSVKKEDMTPLSIDCLAKPMAADPGNGLQGGLYILKPENLIHPKQEQIGLTSQSKQQAYIYGPFVQIYAKCYLRMGLDLSESVLKHIFRIRCAQSYSAPDPSDYLMFRNSFSGERITQTM